MRIAFTILFPVFGLLVYFFAIWYKPVRLLDHMLANVASEIPESMFFFDANGHCIWVNASAQKLTGIGDDLESVPDLLRKMFGEWRQNASEWKGQYSSIDKDYDRLSDQMAGPDSHSGQDSRQENVAGPDSHSRQDSRQENVAGPDSHYRQEGGDQA